MTQSQKPRVDQLLLALRNAETLLDQLVKINLKQTPKTFREHLHAATAAAGLQVLSLRQALRVARDTGNYRWATEPDELDKWLAEQLRSVPIL